MNSEEQISRLSEHAVEREVVLFGDALLDLFAVTGEHDQIDVSPRHVRPRLAVGDEDQLRRTGEMTLNSSASTTIVSWARATPAAAISAKIHSLIHRQGLISSPSPPKPY